ncbi:MAG: maleylpyruvate isomerase N-terminal domain-containing protein [Streptosporangiaceae bacterium]
MAERGPGGATGLLAGALRYALSACAQVKPAELASPTPCVEWDIRALLWHLGESVADLEAGLRTGTLGESVADLGAGLRTGSLGESVADLEAGLPTGSLDDAWSAGPAPARPRSVARLPGDDVADPAGPLEVLRERAAELLCACYDGGPAERFVVVGGLPLPAGIVACTGAVEIAVHGWDVSAALGRGGSIPPALATRLLALCPLLATSREGLFAAAVPIPPEASPGDRLLGYFGRDPGAPPWARPGNYRPGSQNKGRTGTGQPGNWSRRLAAP